MLGFLRRHIAARLAMIWLVVAVPLTAVLLLTYYEWYQARFTIVQQEREGYARSAGASFNLLLVQMRLAMRSSGADAAAAPSSSANTQAALRRLASSYPVAYAALADSRGRIRASTRPALVGSSVATDVAFKAAMRAKDGGGLEPSKVDSQGIVGFHVAQTITGGGGGPPGVMLMFVDVHKLHDSFPVQVPRGGISVVDSAGQVVYQNEFVRFAETRAQWGAKFPFVRQALRGETGRTQNWRFPIGGTRIGVFVPIEPAGWAAGSSVSPAVALAPFYRARLVGIPVVLVVAVLALITSVGISRGIHRPLEQLAQSASRIGSGDLDEPVRAAGEDEIGGVGRSLESARIELREARQTAEQLLAAERERARFGQSMAEINNDLASSLDIDETLPGVLTKVCEELAAHGAGILDRVEGGWRTRHTLGIAESTLEPYAFFAEHQTPTLASLLRTREPHVVADIRAAPGVNADLAERVGYLAFAVYPLIVRGELTGAIAVLYTQPRSLSNEERDYLRRVAFAVSLAEENSRLYEAEHRIAETLQTALLALPEHIPGIAFAHTYHSATEAARVGGDFYDLFELEHDMVGVTIGDISGHGVESAVLTSLVKNAIHVQATQQDRRPNAVMATANQVLYENSPTELFATVFFGVLHLDDGLLEYCSAGHTTGACICSEGGGVRKLHANSPLIGAFPSLRFELSTERLDSGDLVFLYTDGLSEARRNGELFGEERVFELLASEQHGDPTRALRKVVDAVMAFAGGRLSDDMAVLSVQRVTRG